MSWFRRNNDASYMQNTQTVSRPVGIVLTILTILVIGAAIYCLFLGGRWMFKHLDGSNIPKTETTSVEAPAETPQDSNSNTATSGSGSGATSGTATSGSNQAAGTSGSNYSASTSNNTSNTSNSSQTNSISSTGPSTTDIPATGPSNIFVIFAISTILGLVTHSLFIRKKI